VSDNPNGWEMSRSLEAAAERILQGFTSLVARLGCGAVGCVGLVGGGGLLSFKPQRQADLMGGGLYLLASAVAFGALALTSRRVDGPADRRRPVSGEPTDGPRGEIPRT